MNETKTFSIILLFNANACKTCNFQSSPDMGYTNFARARVENVSQSKSPLPLLLSNLFYEWTCSVGALIRWSASFSSTLVVWPSYVGRHLCLSVFCWPIAAGHHYPVAKWAKLFNEMLLQRENAFSSPDKNVARIDDDNFWSVNLLNRYRGYIQLRFVSYEWTCSCLSLVIRCTSLGKIGCCERKLSMSSFGARVTSTPKSKAFFLFSWEQKTQLMLVTCVKSEIVFFFLGYS